ncbi:transcription factor MYB35-like [Chenopodium quinoa]|uniref:Uncharacterized protein n=1 Tax=Chenopodium quinoa TaxID=63459 RepID=A0A803L8Y5_CHEQI|nr:transcription factor MYB35-like [Chenopodium quinoa]
MVRPPPCCDKLNARKGAWGEAKDGTTFAYVSKQGTTNWNSVPRKTGTKRCGKNCRIRWNNNNYTRSDLHDEGFTQQEEELIIKLHAAVGSRWGLIAHQLPGRTENDIKNHWNTKLRKKLTEMGIDPITHKPFSQILADYGNIGGVSRSSDTPKYIGTFRKDLKKASSNTSSLPKPDSFTTPSYTFLSNSQVSHNNILPMQNNYATNSSNSHSLDLLSQLQAISFVTEGPNSDTNVPTNNSSYDFLTLPSPKSSSNSSTSACSSGYNNAGEMAKSPECFSWHDFLLEEAFKPAQSQVQEQEENNLAEFLLINDNRGVDCKEIQAGSSPLIASSDASSFLEAMLDQENDMFLSFPGLMEEPSY